MTTTLKALAIASLVLPFVYACGGEQSGTRSTSSGTEAAAGASTGTSASAGTQVAGTGVQAGASTSTGTTAGAGSGLSIPTLVNVSLQNVLNDLSVALDIDRANIPVNVQLPVQLAANVCGVSVNVLAFSTGGQATCTATTSSQELAQVVSQQMSAG